MSWRRDQEVTPELSTYSAWIKHGHRLEGNPKNTPIRNLAQRTLSSIRGVRYRLQANASGLTCTCSLSSQGKQTGTCFVAVKSTGCSHLISTSHERQRYRRGDRITNRRANTQTPRVTSIKHKMWCGNPEGDECTIPPTFNPSQGMFRQ